MRPTPCLRANQTPRSLQLPQPRHHHPHQPAAGPQPAPHAAPLRHDTSADRLRHDHRRASVRAVHADSQAVGKNHDRNLLGPQRAQLLLVLAVCVHDADGFRAGDCAHRRVFKAADEDVDEDRFVHLDEHDHVVGHRYCGEKHISPPLHRHRRST